ncbi:hypothetical protein [uncultured Sphingomonas sp.]|uniref:hypothetical protein n=1 Tax=uncultured Sphingomonas sp. TaxID=158754 RepID=UPI0035CA7271
MGRRWIGATIAAMAAASGAPAAARSSSGVIVTGGETAAPPPAPTGFTASFVPPARDAAGYLTPGRGLGSAATAWQLSVALAVAARECRGDGAAAIVAAYDALLTTERAAVAAASAGTVAGYKAQYGVAWRARLDEDTARLRAFWGEPAVHDAFCAAADTVLRDAAVTEPSAFGPFAAAALPRLEQPFLAFFAAVDRYRADLAAWRAAHAPQVAFAAVPTPGTPAR